MPRHPSPTGRVCSRLIAAGAIVALVVACTGNATPAPSGPGADGGSGTALATAPSVDGFADDSELVPPILEEGGVPAPENPTPPITGHLQLGPTTDLASETVGAAGGTIAAEGFEIQVPDGALAGDTTFAVTQAPITGQDFGDLITPVTPLYLVDDGDALLAAPVTIVLPATIPDGKTAMAFTYDEAAGMLTPLIPIAQDATTLTVGATHFSGLFGALVDLAKLPTTVDSGFRPGVDDWQFGNYGSYVAPEGQCEGQSGSAIWYYVYQRRAGGASPLFGLYDNNGAPTRTPTLWVDDSDGYRLASSVQADPVAVPFTYAFLKNTMWDAADGRVTYDAFRAVIALSGRPQLVRISAGPGDGGHTMVVYRVTPQWLLIADPNYPGIGRRIRYDPTTGSLGPFVSGNNAADIAAGMAKRYTRFAYVPWESSYSVDSIAAHWAEFEAGTAGDDVFPAYVVEALDTDAQGADVWVPLVDGYQTTEATLTLRLRAPNAVDDVLMKVYRGTSSTVLAMGMQVTIDLEDGENPLGILELGHQAGWTDWEYVDFVRVIVTRNPSPSPSVDEILASNTPGAAADTPVAATGAWVLKLVQPDVGKTEVQFSYPGLACTGGTTVASTETSATTTTTGTCQVTGAVVANETTQHSWSRPPDRLTPGQEVTGSLTASQSGLCYWGGATTEESCRSSVATSHSVWVGDGWPGGQTEFPYEDLYFGNDSAGTARASDHPNGSFEWTVPDGSQGGGRTLLLQFVSGSSGGKVYTNYWYEWQAP